MKTFKRGIHPPDSKNTREKAIVSVSPSEGLLMTFPMVQHIGVPCLPTVKVNDRVFKGQKIGDSDKLISAPIHSSVSGIVKEIKPCLVPSGAYVQSIIIENDGKNEEEFELTPDFDFEKYTPAQIISMVREAGVVGLGGAGFPTHVKLNPKNREQIDTYIVNAAECEPYLTSDYRMIMENVEAVIRGMQIALRVLPNAKGYIGIESNKPEAIEKLKVASNGINNIEIVPLETKYPQGAEKQLIYAITGREVPTNLGLPADVNVVVNNIDTVVAIERAVIIKKPLTRRIMTIDGSLAQNPGNYKIRIGMPYQYLIDHVGGIKPNMRKLISGGPMMGVSLFNLNISVVKTSSAILCFSEDEVKQAKERNCIRCGKCVSNCPMGLMPLELNRYAIFREYDLFKKYSGQECINCGCCSYVCPSKRHLSQSINTVKLELRASKK